MLECQPDGSFTFRCVVCGARFGDFWPPVGKAEVKCVRCNAMNYMSMMPPSGSRMTDDVIWIARRWMGAVMAHGATGV